MCSAWQHVAVPSLQMGILRVKFLSIIKFFHFLVMCVGVSYCVIVFGVGGLWIQLLYHCVWSRWTLDPFALFLHALNAVKVQLACIQSDKFCIALIRYEVIYILNTVVHVFLVYSPFVFLLLLETCFSQPKLLMLHVVVIALLLLECEVLWRH